MVEPPYEYLWVEQVLNSHYGSLLNSLTLLDAACGQPSWLLRATELGFDSVTGVDLNKNSILVDRVKRKGLNYYQHDLANPLPLEYDVVTCISVLEHMPISVQESALANMCSAVRPGGSLLLTLDLPGFNFTTDLGLIWRILDEHKFNYIISEPSDSFSKHHLTPSNSLVKSPSNISENPNLRVYRVFAIKSS